MTKLSTDYHRWNVIRCLMSSQPSLKQWKLSGKALESDAIPAEIYKLATGKLTDLFHIMWRKKKHSSRIQGCNNYSNGKGILLKSVTIIGHLLLSVAGKILARDLRNRLNEHLVQLGLLPENQCGFRKARGTTDMKFTARQLQEKCQELNMDLYMTLSTLPKHLTRSVVRGFGKLWQSLAVLPNS